MGNNGSYGTREIISAHLSVFLAGMEEYGPVVLAYLLPLVNVLDGLHAHPVLNVEADDARVAGVVEHGKRGVNRGADEDGRGALLLVLGGHLELRHLVRVELEHLQEVVEEGGDEELVLSQRVGTIGGDVAAVRTEVALLLQAPADEQICPVVTAAAGVADTTIAMSLATTTATE